MNIRVEIINIGDELLIGQVINTNASWMGSLLSEAGFEVKQIRSIADEEQAITVAIDEAIQNAQIILISGGLGPTKDDITKKVLAKYFDSEMYFNAESYLNIQQLFKARGFQVTEVNKNQAFLPKKAKAIPNRNGTAFGMWFEKRGSIVVSMPGVPFEMKTMMEKEVLPRLVKQFQPAKYFQKTIMTQGLGESFLAKKIESVEDNLPEHIKLAYLPRPGIVRLRFSARGTDETLIQHQVEAEIAKVESILGKESIYGFDDISLEESLAKLLKNSGLKIGTAESCTGGNMAHLISSVAGSSEYFEGAIVSYSNEIKQQLLEVSKDDLEKYGAVSESVVRQMAKGACKTLGVDYAVATSGIAGPSGGTDDKPVGHTWIAVSGPKTTKSVLHQFGEHRGRNISRASLTALNMLRLMILEDI